MGLAITDRKAIRLAPWNPPNKVPPLEDCVVPVSSHRYRNYQLMASLRKIEMSKAASSKLCHTARLDFYNGNTTLSPARLSGTDASSLLRHLHRVQNFVSAQYIEKKNDRMKSAAVGLYIVRSSDNSSL